MNFEAVLNPPPMTIRINIYKVWPNLTNYPIVLPKPYCITDASYHKITNADDINLII